MNKTVLKYINGIRDGETAYLNTTGNILMRYRDEKAKIVATSKRYKNEEEYIQQTLPRVKQETRDALARAEGDFRKCLTENIAGLKTELKMSVSATVPQAFSEKLAFYRASGITPSRTETEALLELGLRSPLATKAVQKLLDDVNAPIKIEARAIEDYESDIANLDDLASMPLVSCPLEVHAELTDVLRGQPKATRTAMGWRDVGEKWNGSVDVLMQSMAVSNRLKALESNADAWTSDISWVLREREYADGLAKQIEDATATGKFEPETQPETSTRIEDRNDPAIALAKEIGAEKASVSQKLKVYVK